MVAVTSPRTFILRASDGRRVTVVLPNVGEPFHASAQEMLETLLRGQQVSVLVGLSDLESDQISGEVSLAKAPDVSQRLIRAGMAAYVEAPRYTLSSYSECLNRIAEQEARAARVGVWAFSEDPSNQHPF